MKRLLKRPAMSLLVSIVVTVVLFVTIVTSVLAYSNSADYLESTCYWEVTCNPVGFHSTGMGNGVSKKLDSTTWSIDTQSFGGNVFPKYSLCGTSAFVKQSAYWVDSNGNYTITGWQNTGALCDSNTSCDSWYSGTNYTLFNNPHGNWYFATAYGGDCLPAGSISNKLLTVYP